MGQCEALVEIFGVAAWVSVLYSAVVVRNAFRKSLFYLADVESRAEPAVNLVNDVEGEACNFFFDFVDGYL